MSQSRGPRLIQYLLLALAAAAMVYGVRARYQTMVARTIAGAASASAAAAPSHGPPARKPN